MPASTMILFMKPWDPRFQSLSVFSKIQNKKQDQMLQLPLEISQEILNALTKIS